MARTLGFYQILYAEGQRQHLYNFSRPVFSIGLTPYFENAWIAGIVPACDADYIGVCSWRLAKKRMDGFAGIHLRNTLTEDEITSTDFDVAILTPHHPSHKALHMAAHWHGKAWTDAFGAFKPFLSQFGRIPEELRYPIYENHFIARKEIYHDYVNRYLIPATTYIGSNPVFFADSGYRAKKRDSIEIERVTKILNRSDWPILPFLLERLFSLYINDKGLNVINL